tara:strand:- start:787 stop:1173 length:387 start_codon:yes stop_codon:yes gene_type:complete
MIDEKELSEEDTVKVFKLVTGEEIVTRVADTTDQFFVIEIPLEIRYNSVEQRLFLSRWKMGADYSKVMTLAGSAIVSVSGPEEIVLENYFEYRKQLVKSLTEENEPEPGQEEHEQIVLDLEEETPTFH